MASIASVSFIQVPFLPHRRAIPFRTARTHAPLHAHFSSTTTTTTTVCTANPQKNPASKHESVQQQHQIFPSSGAPPNRAKTLLHLAMRASRSLSTASSLAILALFTGARCAHARAQFGNNVTLTDQVPNFTLPSREASLQQQKRTSGVVSVLIKAANLTKKAAPVIATIALIVWLVGKALRRAQEKQLRDFQAQLQSFSSMLDLDTAALAEKSQPSSAAATAAREAADAAGIAKTFLEKGASRRYKFRANDERSANVNTQTNADIESKVRLDLFRGGRGASNEATASEGSPNTAVVMPSAVPTEPLDSTPKNEFENAVASALNVVRSDDAGSARAALAVIEAAREKTGLSEEESSANYNAFVSRVVSAHIDRAATHLDSDDRESLKNLHELTVTMNAAQMIARESETSSGVVYIGAHRNEEKTREELYRRYAVFCLSSLERAKDDLQSLADMQNLLQVGDARAETINRDIAKGMFQVAVSAAMKDGNLDEESRDALEKLKESFGDFLEGAAADSIVSEVAVMRAMYSLQNLLQEQGVTEEDVKQLRRMCAELGVDIDEMLENADVLVNVLGPEAGEFVESLRKLIADKEGNGDALLTTAVSVDGSAQKDELSNGKQTNSNVAKGDDN